MNNKKYSWQQSVQDADCGHWESINGHCIEHPGKCANSLIGCPLHRITGKVIPGAKCTRKRK